MQINAYNTGLGSGALWGSVSGLNDAQERLSVVAHNVANLNTSGFVPQRVNSQAVPSGGVATTVESAGNTMPATAAGDSKPLDNAQRDSLFLEFSQTDLGTELGNMVVAKRAYEANARVLKATDESWRTLIKNA